MGKSKNGKKNGGNIMPILVIAIIAFLAYKANPEYWQQGRLFEDLKNHGQKKVETEDISNIPTPEETKPAIDPDAILEGSVKGAKTIPINVNKAVNKSDPTYEIMRSKFKVFYMVYPDNPTAAKISDSMRAAIEKNNLRGEYTFASLLYTQSNKKQICGYTKPQAFLCEQCDKKICLINPKNKEFIVVAPTTQAAIGRAKALKGEW